VPDGPGQDQASNQTSGVKANEPDEELTPARAQSLFQLFNPALEQMRSPGNFEVHFHRGSLSCTTKSGGLEFQQWFNHVLKL
jgi:hypothetical protein